MKKLISLFKTFRTEEDGAAMIEYSILIGLIAAAIIALVLWMSDWIVWAWEQLGTALLTTSYTVALPGTP